MPPLSRRQKKYEQELRRVKNRNLFAGIVLVIGLIGAGILFAYLLPDRARDVFVSISYVENSGTRSLPFARQSSEKIEKAFGEKLESATLDLRPLDDKKMGEELTLFKDQISSNDILIVYLNAHLKVSGAEQGQTLCYVGPEATELAEMPLEKLLETVRNSKAAIKVVLLDAGRYSWSPALPDRPENKFVSALDRMLADWSDESFWVITSHSDYEISTVSTPLKQTLFSLAITETLEKLAADNVGKFSVNELFEELKRRTTTYARNFNRESLQNPVLLRAGQGLVESMEPTQSAAEADELALMFRWKRRSLLAEPSGEEAAKPTDVKFEWRDFAESGEEFADWVRENTHYDALPGETLKQIELFLESGEADRSFTLAGSQELQAYTEALNETTKRTSEPTDFDDQLISSKQIAIAAYRKSLLEYSLLLRFRNQLKFLYDRSRQEVEREELIYPPAISDAELMQARRLPASVNQWLSQWADYKKRTRRQFFGVLQRQLAGNQAESLSPLQAELLGVLSQRYLPLLQDPAAQETAANERPKTTEDSTAVQRPPNITLDIGMETTPFEKVAELVPQAIAETEQLCGTPGASADQLTDAQLRLRLAAKGSEGFANAPRGRVPDIAWQTIKPTIKIVEQVRLPSYKVSPSTEPTRIRFQLQTVACPSLEVALEPILDDQQSLPRGLEFGLNENFAGRLPFELLPKEGTYNMSQPFDVYIRYTAADFGKTVNFELTATDQSLSGAKAEPTRLRFSVLLTEEAPFAIIANRKFARLGETTARLHPWGAKLNAETWEPLVLKTLANVKAPFELSIGNQTNRSATFNLRLYEIERFPNGISPRVMSADRNDVQSTSSYIGWLNGQTATTGQAILQQPTYFKLLGQADSISVQPGQRTPVPLASPPIAEGEPAVEPAAEAIERGMVVVLSRSESPDKPAFFQLVRFEPQRSANVGVDKRKQLAFRADLEDVFPQTELESLPLFLATSGTDGSVVDLNSAAKLTIVSEATIRGQESDADLLKVDDLLDNRELVSGAERALLMVELLGVPNYATYFQNGGAANETNYRNELFGVKLLTSPEVWAARPATWSLVSDVPVEDSWLAGSTEKERLIFVKPLAEDSPDIDRTTFLLQFFLPFDNDDTLSSAPADFWWKWRNEPTTLYYPNARSHRIFIGPEKLEMWSEIRPHSVAISGISNKTLELGKVDANGRQTPSRRRWTFVTESLGNRPSLETNSETELFADAIRTTIIRADLNPIQPHAEITKATLLLNDKPLKDSAGFLLANQSEIDPLRFEFSLAQILDQFEIEEFSKRQEFKVEIAVADFFDKTTDRAIEFVVKPRPKPVVIKEPEPIPVTITFATGEQAAKIHSFDLVVIDGRRIPLSGNRGENGGYRVVGSKSSASLKIEGLKPGKHNFVVNVTAYEAGIAIPTAQTFRQSGFELSAEQNTIGFEVK